MSGWNCQKGYDIISLSIYERTLSDPKGRWTSSQSASPVLRYIIVIIIIIIVIVITIITIIMMGVDDKWGLDWPRATDHSWIPFQSSCQSQPAHNSIINIFIFSGPGCFFRVFFSIYNLQS